MFFFLVWVPATALERQGQERRPKYVISVSACTDSDDGSDEEYLGLVVPTVVGEGGRNVKQSPFLP